MKDIMFFPAGITDSCKYAAHFLKLSNYSYTDHFSPDITHVILDIPSFDSSGRLRDGSDLQDLLLRLPESVTVIGGKLNHPLLSGYKRIDLLESSFFAARNAAITAECALQLGATHLSTTYSESPALVLGWGKIGKCLTKLLASIGCNVTVAARKESDRAMLNALGYRTLDFPQIPRALSSFRILFNTVPQQTVDADALDQWCRGIKIDLASSPGITCKNIITARGLPAKYAPESAGKLIAQSIDHVFKEVTI